MISRMPSFIYLLILAPLQMFAQADNLAYKFTGVVYDEYYNPIPYTHVIASGTGKGDMTDTLGIFILYIRESDKLSFFNLTFNDTTVSVSKDQAYFYIKLRRKVYELQEAKVFDWGSSYGDFLEEIKREGIRETQGEKLGLPQQDPDIVPFDRDEKKIKSAGFLIHSPISFLYYNFSRREKAARKAYKLQQNKDLIATFIQTLSADNIQSITGLAGEELEAFLIHLNSHLHCDYTCGEIELLSEIYSVWEAYKQHE